jgi:hypothetical protein
MITCAKELHKNDLQMPVQTPITASKTVGILTTLFLRYIVSSVSMLHRGNNKGNAHDVVGKILLWAIRSNPSICTVAPYNLSGTFAAFSGVETHSLHGKSLSSTRVHTR